jgi:ribulose 1,5-bisphosphate carboxylase large subunit-like protein
MAQQSLLSDQAAQNAAKQFGATSQNQIDQFIISQSNNMMQFNTSAQNAMESFNVTEANRTAAIEAGNQLQADSLTAQLEADISKFNASIDNQRDTWNAANAQAVEQSNVSWRRQANTADTAAANSANQQNVQNAYNISALDQTQLWQQLRDEAAYVRQAFENNEQREAQLIATAIGNESAAGGDKNSTSTKSLLDMLKNVGVDGTYGDYGYVAGAGGGQGTGSGQNGNQQTAKN